MYEIALKTSAKQEDALVARMAVSGLGLLAGLDADTIGDLQTVVNECVDCLIHQPVKPENLELRGWVEKEKLHLCFDALGNAGQTDEKPLDLDVVRGILETLMPEVQLCSDMRGVCSIACAIAV
jgi:hypothetical protein